MKRGLKGKELKESFQSLSEDPDEKGIERLIRDWARLTKFFTPMKRGLKDEHFVYLFSMLRPDPDEKWIEMQFLSSSLLGRGSKIQLYENEK